METIEERLNRMTITTDGFSKSGLQILSDMSDGELRDQLECDPESEYYDDYEDWELGEEVRGEGVPIVKGSREIMCKTKASAKYLLKSLEKHTHDGVVV